MSRHTLSVLVENKPGVLARVASLFSRRGFNIDSLSVGATELTEVSRMTIVVNVEELPLRSEQARCAGAGGKSVLASRLQHRLPRGGPDRAPRGLADDDRRQRRGAAAPI